MLRESLQNFNSRRENIAALSRQPFDLLVVGGGIHGAAFAYLAALNGFRTVLLENADFAQGTSSRSSKMLHGGLRYLEHFDFGQVFEGVKAREDLFRIANHLCHPTQFLLPIKKGDWWYKFKVQIGLKLYELFLRDKARRSQWISASSNQFDPFGAARDNYIGGFLYSDGIMDDTRLVLDTLIASRQEGALCLNHVEIESLVQNQSGSIRVKWRDKLSDLAFGSFEVGGVVNCAGPWVHGVGNMPALKSLRYSFRLSRGSHLLFSKKWTKPSVILPLQEYGRYYFVWPHQGGTLVGTTEREVGNAPLNAEPSQEEIQEILGNLARDLPASGLDRSTLHSAYAGIRTLPVASTSSAATGALSRKHRWFYEGGILSLVGGKFTTAFRTAAEGLKVIARMADLKERPVKFSDRLLPGAGDIEKESQEFRKLAEGQGVPNHLINRVINRLGTKVNSFIATDDLSWFESISDVCLRGEVEFAVRVEQAETLDDLICRRLGLELIPGHGLDAIDKIGAIF
jgi:glycerol-3-phosphate dehydrogenase